MYHFESMFMKFFFRQKYSIIISIDFFFKGILAAFTVISYFAIWFAIGDCYSITIFLIFFIILLGND